MGLMGDFGTIFFDSTPVWFNFRTKQSSKDMLSDCLLNGVCWKEKVCNMVLDGWYFLGMTEENGQTYRSCDCFWDPTVHNFEKFSIEKEDTSGRSSGLGVTAGY
ncbi:hypothetical protein F2Q70_00034378 [Brassica cretica]|uniref:Uncharacterized protein n=3 Tax=Brassica TaxID=3705 RepID=A0A8S9JYB5_BRACR|nr:hypothetical protein F2Q68_00029282 [Brassica cretica]KAF2586839.1 hypothetical protein F2Q70_00034378 [Brassica cretica]